MVEYDTEDPFDEIERLLREVRRKYELEQQRARLEYFFGGLARIQREYEKE